MMLIFLFVVLGSMYVLTKLFRERDWIGRLECQFVETKDANCQLTEILWKAFNNNGVVLYFKRRRDS